MPYQQAVLSVKQCRSVKKQPIIEKGVLLCFSSLQLISEQQMLLQLEWTTESSTNRAVKSSTVEPKLSRSREGKWKRFKHCFSVCKQWVETEEGVMLFLTIVDSEAPDDFNSFQLTCRKKLYWKCVTEIQRKLHSMSKKTWDLFLDGKYKKYRSLSYNFAGVNWVFYKKLSCCWDGSGIKTPRCAGRPGISFWHSQPRLAL